MNLTCKRMFYFFSAAWENVLSDVHPKNVQILRTCHHHDEQPSQGTKPRIDEEQIRTKHTPHMKTQTHKQRTATEEQLWNVK